VPADGDVPHVPRDERRRRSEQAILDAARELFAEQGFERTTIRAVASGAGVDPALVMQHYGTKDRLFAEASRWRPEAETVFEAQRADVAAAALHDVFTRFEGDDRESAIALMRNCLTHPGASRIVRDEVLYERIERVAETLDDADAQLRAGLLAACLIGLTMARHLLEVEPVASASRADLERLLEPALRQLVDPRGGGR
jgi:AcrR family transcriptional regulator